MVRIPRFDLQSPSTFYLLIIMDLETQLEAVLFWRGEGVPLSELCRVFRVTSAELKKALEGLQEKLRGRGVAVIWSEDKVALATAPDASEFIERLQKEELARDLGKAALETLSIILYKGRVSRRDIDYIRGVNSTSILRSLLIRGLIEREQNKEDERQFLYGGTVELLALLGITKADELPEFAEVRQELDAAATAPEEALLLAAEPAEDSEIVGES